MKNMTAWQTNSGIIFQLLLGRVIARKVSVRKIHRSGRHNASPPLPFDICFDRTFFTPRNDPTVTSPKLKYQDTTPYLLQS